MNNKLKRDKRKNLTIRIFSIVLFSSFFIGFIIGCKEAQLSTDPERPVTPTTTTPVTTGNDDYNQYKYLFTAPRPTTKLDILICVDNSSSMSPDQRRLGRGFNSLIHQIRASHLNYQIAFITSDMSGNGPTQNGNLLPIAGDRNNYILRSTDTNQAYKFRKTVERPEIGSSDERCIYAAITALNRNQHGIIRSNADLAIFFISDEDSRGEGGTHGRPLEDGKDYGRDLVQVALRIKDNKKVTIHAIIVDPDSNDNNCLNAQRAQGEDATPHYGVQYQAAANGTTNGMVGSICDASYDYQLEQMSYRLVSRISSINLNDLNLECTPDQTGNRRVTIENLPENRYSVNGQSITFNPHLISGNRITINYWCKN